MRAERNMRILTEGLKAAHARMFQGNGLQKPEYPRDFMKLYGWSEDSLFNLFDAIKSRQFTEMRENAADMIILMSEIIEHAENLAALRTEGQIEVANN
jgi:hypothetical protein